MKVSVNLIAGKVKKDGKCGITLKLIYSRKKRYIRTQLSITLNQWDPNKQRVINHKEQYRYNQYLNEIIKVIDDVILDNLGKYPSIDSLKELIEHRLNMKSNVDTLETYCQQLCGEMIQQGRAGNAKAINTAVVQFINAIGRDVSLSEIDYNLLRKFKLFKQTQSCKSNTIGAYLRAIRMIYNEAVRSGLVNNKEYPFKRGLIPGNQVTAKRAVDSSLITKLEDIRPTLTGNMKLATDIRLLQFYLRGTDFIDVSTLTRFSIKNDMIYFQRFKNRNKTNTSNLCVKLIPKAQAILNEYTGGKYLLPMLNDIDLTNNYNDIGNKRKGINQSMGYVLKKLNYTGKLTSKMIRHTWATVARERGVPYDLIQQCLGHSTSSITDIYIKYGQHQLDEANELVCNGPNNHRSELNKITA